MSREEVYARMAESCFRNIEVTLSNGGVVTGYVDVFESRFDNEDDDGELKGKGSICLFPDGEDPMLLIEDDIRDIRILKS